MASPFIAVLTNAFRFYIVLPWIKSLKRVVSMADKIRKGALKMKTLFKYSYLWAECWICGKLHLRMAVIFLTMLCFSIGFIQPVQAAGYKVMLNGEYLTFHDAHPQNIDGKIMVPFQDMMEAMEVDISWDAGARRVLAQKGETFLSFIEEQNSITLLKNGEQQVLYLEAPLLHGPQNQKLAEIRLLAEIFDYTVGWDAKEQAVILIDAESILEDIEQDFSVLTKILQSSYRDLSKGYEGSGTFYVTYDMGDQIAGGNPIHLALDGTMNLAVKDLKIKETVETSIDFGELLPPSGMEMPEKEDTALQALKNMKFSTYMDALTGDMYINSSLFSQINPAMNEKTWIHFNSYEMYEDMGIDLQGFMRILTNDSGDFKQVLLSFMQNKEESFTVYTYQNWKDFYEKAEQIVGNSAFDVKTEQGKEFYTLKIDLDNLNFSMEQSLDKTVPVEYQPVQDFNVQLICVLENDILTESYADVSLEFPGYIIQAESRASLEDASVTMMMDFDKQMQMNMNMEVSIKEMQQNQEVVLPEDIEIIHAGDMIKEGAGRMPVPEGGQEVPAEKPAA